MNGVGRVWLIFAVVVLFGTTASAQYCNPAVVDYIVRDEERNPLTEAELRVVYEQLPKAIGDAQTALTEVSFAADGQTFYWPESVDWQTGKKISALEFANAATCTMHLDQVDLLYHGMRMSLIFNLDIGRTQRDRRPVIDSVRFQEGTFRLDLTGWTHNEGKMIGAERWKRQEPKVVKDH